MIKTMDQTGISERIVRLKRKILETRPSVCTERARFYTEMYRQYQDGPVILKRAHALDRTLRRMSIFIDDDELIVGNHSSKVRAAPIFPEYAVQWILDELDEFDRRPGDAFFLDQGQKRDLMNICRWWKSKTLIERGYANMSPINRAIHESGIIRAEGNLTSGDAHIAVNLNKILKIGLDGYLREVRIHKQKLKQTDRVFHKKSVFYEALEIGITAFQHFIGRFASLAGTQSSITDNPERKAELELVGMNCRQIAHHPPENFYQALQLVYFVQLVLQIESNGHSVSLGRLDQYLFPFYRSDVVSGGISREKVLELLENTWLKLLSINKIRSWSHTRYSAGSPLYQNVTIGGQTVNGKDAANELSYLILESVGNLKLPQPNLSVRYHSGISDDFLQACIKVIEKGFGMPAFNNDEIVIPALMQLGVSREDAFNYSAIGCIEIAVPGRWGYRCTGMSFLNLMRVLLASLNNGCDTMTNQTFKPGYGSLATFKSYDDLISAWKDQIEFYTRQTIEIDAAVDFALEELVPDVLCSAFVDDCIDRGLTIKEGGSRYDFISGLQVGIANLGNALAAIKKLVFEERRITAEELVRHLENNFEGKEGEKVRHLLLNHAPKYGNDDDYVDQLLKEAYSCYIDELEKYTTTRHNRGPVGCRYYAGTSSISANVPSGSVVPATPDGRKAFTPLAEGCSPTSGTDRSGPTAVFKSVSKLPAEKILGGVLLNQKLNPASIRNERDKQKLVSIIRTFFSELKGWHVQYNIVDRNVLLAAKKDPEHYRDLVVRVAGYSAFFTTLSPDTQDDIIARTEHTI